MTLGAFHGNVLALQRVLGAVVLLHAEERRFPAIHGVAFRAFPFFRPSFELTLVRIRLVAVRTIGERQGPLKVAIQMAGHAAHLGVHTEQRVFRL